MTASPPSRATAASGASLPDLLARGLDAHMAGRMDEAIDLYLAALAHDPEQPDALHLLGEIAHRAGQHERAIELIARSLTRRPGHAEAHNNLGAACQALGRLDEAETSYRQALRLKPALTMARNNFGTVLKAKGDRAAARQEFEKAIAFDPDSAEARLNLGNLCREAGDLAGAETLYRAIIRTHASNASAWNNLGITLLAERRVAEGRDALARAVALDPRAADAYSNLGNAQRELGAFEEALACYQQALALRPSHAEAANNLGIALASRFLFREALPFLRQAVANSPDFVDALLNLGACLRNLDHLSEAVQYFDRALALEPSHAGGRNSRGLTLIEMGCIEEGLSECRRAINLKPGFTRAHNNYLFGLNYRPDITGEALLAEHRQFETDERRPPNRRFANARDPDRRLRIGYLSPDFKYHSCAFFIEPLLAAHDKSAVDVFCYADAPMPDAVTARLAKLTDHWHDVTTLDDAALCATLLADGIDIAVDLAGHTGNNRLGAFARRMAPLQVSWLGYPCTTGLSAIDHRVSDGIADPADAADSHYVERLVRLPRTFLAYRPPAGAPAPGPMPALAGAAFTFASFNNLSKVNDRVIDAWAAILHRVPGARLLLKSRALVDAPTCARIGSAFARRGVDPARVELVAWIGDPADHMRLYDRVDLALDPFPYNGTTTTCEALWMGVPVLTLAGARHAARVGASLLTQVGLRELIASSLPDYIDRAAAFAAAPGRLAAIRGGLRERMAGSPLRDETGFARDVEAAYRAMWRAWCRGSDAD